jgi:hypothetical protein
LTGTPALDQRRKQDGQINYNNSAYIAVSKLYLQDDIAFIRADPGQYSATVGKAATLWFVPPGQYFGVSGNEHHVAAWSDVFDSVILWQPSSDDFAAYAALLAHAGPDASQVPYASIAVYGIAVLGAPFVIWRRRQTDRALSATLSFLWLTVVYSFLATSLIEFSENNRFRFELGPLPLVTVVVVVSAIVGDWQRRHSEKKATFGARYSTRTLDAELS